MQSIDLQNLFIEKGWTLSTAESCTGGSLAATLTQVAGASAYFVGSIVAYSNELKIHLLKVAPELLQKHGAVSREVVAAMLDGILEATQSDFALAVSGIAGPTGGTEEKPVGTVWAGIGRKDGFRQIWHRVETGNRSQIITSTVHHLIEELYKKVQSLY